MFEYNHKQTDGKVNVELSELLVEHGTSEYQLMLHYTLPGDSFEIQLSAVLTKYKELQAVELQHAVPVFIRLFVSDLANQEPLLRSAVGKIPAGAVSIVEQPPLDGTKIAMWAYLQTGVRMRLLDNGLSCVEHGVYRHYWSGSSFCEIGDSETQTRHLLMHYIGQLDDCGCRLSDDCIRTWFFVQNVDVNYSGVVKARNEVFATQNLTSKTHYISSTGINGRHADPNVLVQMDTYAVHGLQPEQIQFLYAPAFLNPTYEYGVSFERGTCVIYGDRRQVFISGTASIDNKGAILYEGDVRKQTERMWQNVQALLEEAECEWNDVQQMIVYLRDVADYTLVKEMYTQRFPQKPLVIVLAPVCRPGWLIEMECMAVRLQRNDPYPNF